MLTLMTVNLNYRKDTYGPWEQRKRALLDLIRDVHPNVVALQAVDGAGDQRSQAQELAEDTGYLTAVFAAADVQTRQGSAFLLDRPAFQVETQAVARHPEDEDSTARILLGVRVALNREGVTGWIVNGHFSWIPAQNQRHIAQAREFMQRLGGAVVLMGDFNAAPTHAGPAELARHGLVDCWLQQRSDDPGYTFSSDQPRTRIDYIWVDPHSARVQEIHTAPGAGPVLSDHRALIATLET
ncbi:MAG TPA: endonuclease/exonuclease/phosphatase family protein [Acidiferrobacteraceae bacterium]|nr:endonuclease/exonuclease/phosphatase family protein [Acidiferrobacteraceae bacterium]